MSRVFFSLSLSLSLSLSHFFLLILKRNTHLSYANNVDPYPRFVAFDQDLHCLPTSLLWDTMPQWINDEIIRI